MSNVLIGIIGVILFIGLALAGALFLGPRFQDATTSSKAAAMVQQASQVAQARAMYRVQEGAEPTGFDETSVMPGYLKAKPVNPSNADNNYNALDVNGDWAGVSGTGKPGYVVIAGIGGDAATADAICAAIAKQSGTSGPQEITSLTQISREVSCIKPTVKIGQVAPNIYVAARI